MLTPEQKAEAEKRLKQMELEKQSQKKIKEIVKINAKKINDLVASLKDDPKKQRAFLNSLSSKIGSMSLSFEKLARGFETAEQKMKSEREQLNKQKLLNMQQKERVQISIEQIKDTIKRIQETVAASVKEEADKRFKISDDLEKSLGEIEEKIVSFEKQSAQLEVQNEVLRSKKKQITEKMAGLELNFKQKAQQKDDEVRKQKQQLMTRLQKLEAEVSEVTEINKQLSNVQKSNFDKKLSLYLKEKKFHEYSTSFENSAKTIDQCKEEIFKGVQRMNDAKETIEKSQREVKQLGNNFLVELKKKTQKQSKIDSVKKQKEAVRERIINLQNKLKEQKNKDQAA